jgi:hypothetical protein
MNLFGFQFPLKKKEDKRDIEKKESFALSETGDGALAVEYAAGGFLSSYINLDYHAVNDTQLILKYRDISLHPEVESAIEEIVGEAIVTQDWTCPVKIITDKLDYPKSIRQKIAKEFDTIITLLNFNTKGYELFRRWYIDSRLVHHVIVDENNQKQGICDIRFIDPVNIRKIKEFKEKILPNGNKTYIDKEEYFLYRHDGFRGGASVDKEGIRISPDAISYVTSGLYDSNKKMIIGYLHKAIKAINQLRLMEDALIIYRLSRAPERRLFQVEVGNIPNTKADAYVKNLMNMHRNKPVYDVSTGNIADGARHMAMLEDFWVPVRDGKGTNITSLPGGQNLGQIEDINFFLKKLYKTLGLPPARMMGQESGGINFSNSAAEISRDEIRFSKFIQRLRNKFSELFYDLLKKQLLLKNIVRNEEEWNEKIRDYVFFDYIQDSYYSEAKNNEIWIARANLLNMLDPYVGTVLSKHWIQSNILNFNDQEISDMDKEIEKEKKLGENLLTARENDLPDLPDLPDLNDGVDGADGQDQFAGTNDDTEEQQPDAESDQQPKEDDAEFQKI